MRVIAGTARSLPLKTPAGKDTRPTSDKTKETLFNVLMPCIADADFLDLYAGSGGIGIEALSRGAASACFVEKGREALKCIEDNLNFTKFADRALIMKCDVLMALRQLEGKRVFDIIFMDPPYHEQQEERVLEYLSSSSLISEDSVIVVEASKETSFDYLEDMGYHIIKQKEYKTNKHVWIEKEASL